MSRSITKAQVVGELAEKAGIPKVRAAAVLQALSELVYREAANGIIVPGLCKFEVVDRKPRRCRDPRSGAKLIIGAHKGVRVRPVKRAKDRIAPLPPGIVRPADEPPPAEQERERPPATPAEKPPAEPFVQPVAQPAERPVEALQTVLFSCRKCGSEVEALPDMEGRNMACPWCGVVVVVPAIQHGVPPPSGSSDSSIPAQTAVAETQTLDDAAVTEDAAEFVYFRCQSCGQEIEAPKDMAGTGAPCPGCDSPLEVPAPMPVAIPVGADDDDVLSDDMDDMLLGELKKRTIRIQLPRAIPKVEQKRIIFRR
jgi:DNA-binding protein HU-beta